MSHNKNLSNTTVSLINKKENITEVVKKFDEEISLTEEEENFLSEISKQVSLNFEKREIIEKKNKNNQNKQIENLKKNFIQNETFEDYLQKLKSYKETCENLKNNVDQLTATTNTIESTYTQMLEKMEEYKDCEFLFFEIVKKKKKFLTFLLEKISKNK